jgi:RNA polymerase sigma-70 factor, ECF subfamily
MDRLALLNATEARLKGLLLLALAGDNASYALFLKDLGGHLRAFLRRRLLSIPDEVEDLLQESLLAVHNQRHTYDSGQPLTAWVQAIARYKLIDFLRRRATHEALEVAVDADEEGMDIFAAADDDAADARRDVATLLEQLPPGQRLPITHMKISGLSVAETARLTGMSESAVKVGVHRGLKALAAKMRGEK